MIISLKKYKLMGPVVKLLFSFKHVYVTARRFFVLKPRASYFEASHIREGSYDFFPSLNMDREDETNIRFNCVSCSLCQVICPTDAITLNGESNKEKHHKKIQSSDFDPYSGKSPKSFDLNTSLCIKCGACKDVCLVNGINMKGLYSTEQADLVKHS